MPFIDKDSIKKKRGEIRAVLPGFKVSVRNMDYMGVRIVIQEGPVDFDLGDRGYKTVNHFHYRSCFADRPDAVEVLDRVMAIAAGDQRESFYDSDYGSVPNFYVRLSIGEWDRPYQIKGANK